MRRMERVMSFVLSKVARRLTDGHPAEPGLLPARLLTIVSSDVDLGAGVGAVWLV